MGENQLIATTQRACRKISELEFALFTPTTTLENFLPSFDYPSLHIITAMLSILNTLLIIDLGNMIAEINTIRATILTIATTIIIMVVSHRKKSIMFVEKKVVTLISI